MSIKEKSHLLRGRSGSNYQRDNTSYKRTTNELNVNYFDIIDKSVSLFDIQLLLERHGWRASNIDNVGTHFTRPGKDSGKSACLYTNKKFKVFTSNADIPESRNGEAYSPSDLICFYDFNNDKRAYFKAVASKFNNTSIDNKPIVLKHVHKQATSDVKHTANTNTTHNIKEQPQAIIYGEMLFNDKGERLYRISYNASGANAVKSNDETYLNKMDDTIIKKTSYSYVNAKVTIKQLIHYYIAKGITICCSLKANGGRGDTKVAGIDLIGIDIDNNIDKSEMLLTLIEFLTSRKYLELRKKVAFIYTTSSHSITQNRFRIFFNADGYITNKSDYLQLWGNINNEILAGTDYKKASDYSTSDINRIWFGSNSGTFIIPSENYSKNLALTYDKGELISKENDLYNLFFKLGGARYCYGK